MNKGKRRKKTTKERIFNLALGILMLAVVVVVLYPIYGWYKKTVDIVGVVHHSGGYSEDAFYDLNFYLIARLIMGLFNTFWRAVIGTILGGGVNGILAFILSRKEFRFRKQLAIFWIVACSLEIGMIPLRVFYEKIDLMYSFHVYFIPGLVNIIYVFVMKAYMGSIPDGMIEQARMEGASYGKIYFALVYPLCKPIYAAVALYIAAFHWNSFLDTLLFNNSCERYTTLQYELLYLGYTNRCDWAFSGARSFYWIGGILSMIPIMIFGMCMQKYYFQSVEALIAYSKKKG